MFFYGCVIFDGYKNIKDVWLDLDIMIWWSSLVVFLFGGLLGWGKFISVEKLMVILGNNFFV